MRAHTDMFSEKVDPFGSIAEPLFQPDTKGNNRSPQSPFEWHSGFFSLSILCVLRVGYRRYQNRKTSHLSLCNVDVGKDFLCLLLADSRSHDCVFLERVSYLHVFCFLHQAVEKGFCDFLLNENSSAIGTHLQDTHNIFQIIPGLRTRVSLPFKV